jgi:iron complex outermembrane receptor protein
MGPVPVRGNLGVQVIGVKQGSDGLAVDNDNITPLHGGSDYRDVLPSLNLNFDLSHFVDRAALRFGAAKTVARPQMQACAPARSTCRSTMISPRAATSPPPRSART